MALFESSHSQLLRENNLLESTSLWIKRELRIDANPGLARISVFEQPGLTSLNNRAKVFNLGSIQDGDLALLQVVAASIVA